MKASIMKCARWCLGWQSRFICLSSVVLLFCVLSARAQTDVTLKPIGGDGGGQFTARCAQGQRLAGVEIRTGDDVDAIRPLCISANGPADAMPLVPGGIWFGGNGGGPRQLVCPRDTPVLGGMYVLAAGLDTVIVNKIYLYCNPEHYSYDENGEPEPGQDTLVKFDGKTVRDSFGIFETHFATTRDGSLYCTGDAWLPVGIHGRSGIWLDAVGLICGEPKLQEVVKLTGRVKKPQGTGPPPISICEAAREARARKSPAAPGLEAQCRAAGAAGELPPVKAVPRVKGSSSADAPPISICEAAREARERNSPAAPGLETQCRADLAAKGAAIAQHDPILAEARAAEAGALYQQGFDIATGIFGDPAQGAQGNTAVGPGSLKIREALSAAGKRGFDASVKLHLSRDYKP